ncbi:eukaryotic translation initiation factor 3 subunit F-like [Clytia hemisphaerica]|uniref:EIF3F/CSN6-like C-terminal domain-containing protein n=1 Tax=Clytia hemisphaerica TaxID=252671 RepID=A0A7M5XMG5_9CNID
MLDLHKQASRTEDIVGWFATSDDVTDHSTLIHEYYSIATDNPIHFTVDTQMKNGRMAMKAYVSSTMGVPGGTTGLIFTPIPHQIKYEKAEAVAVETFSRNKGGSKSPAVLQNGVHHVSRSTDVLVDRLKETLQYVKEVVNGDRVGDNEIGRKLMSIVGSVPQMEASQVEQMMNNNMQDLLMVLYLSSLTKSQLSVGNKLNSIM